MRMLMVLFVASMVFGNSILPLDSIESTIKYYGKVIYADKDKIFVKTSNDRVSLPNDDEYIIGDSVYISGNSLSDIHGNVYVSTITYSRTLQNIKIKIKSSISEAIRIKKWDQSLQFKFK